MDAFESLAQDLLGEGDVVEGQMFGMPVLKAGGKVFAGLSQGGFVVKLPAARVEELKATGAGADFDPMGKGMVMKEWVLVTLPAGEWRPFAVEAKSFVTSG
jgi:hypothetical protein